MPELTIDEALRVALDHHRAGHTQEAAVIYQRILRLDPRHLDATHLTGIALLQSGQPQSALEWIDRAIALQNDVAILHHNRGEALQQLGQLAEAAASYRRATTLDPTYFEAWNNLGTALERLGELSAAAGCYGTALRLRPNLPQLCGSLLRVGASLHRAGNSVAAEHAYQEVLRCRPDDADALHLLGTVHFQRGETSAALLLVQRAVESQPTVAIYRNTLGLVLDRLGRTAEATANYQRATELDPGYAEAHNNLGSMREREGRLTEAEASFRRALALNPNLAQASSNLAALYRDEGDLDQAIASYRAALAADPKPTIHDNLLLTLHYHPDYGPAELAREHRNWATRHATPLHASIRPHANDRSPDRRLRIGYVSPDLREHAVARFLLPVLQRHDRAQFEVHAYADVARPDAVTEKLRAAVDGWHDITHRPHREVAEAVRRDGIDILVDLAAHTAGSRLIAFAEKPAPVQVTYLAYCSTTGLETIDYRFSDLWLDPPGADLSQYVEKTVRLPDCYWCYPVPEAPAAIDPLPARGSGRITFGCLNNFSKVTAPTLRMWTQILRENRDAELLLHARDGDYRDAIRRRLEHAGLPTARVRFVGRQSFPDYLATYREIDIGLDPFPFNGGTTTCDTLWMGIPVVSLAGRTAVSRAGASLLTNVGLSELVVRTSEAYVALAGALAKDRARLAQLRDGMRARMLASPLMDAPRFCGAIESAYRAMWQRWCESPAA